ncbi:MAG: toxin-antitoxin system YwqK family antitoxin [Bacteroidales bacterium]|nr:toxin-antitoxin system YwqK family antitoxin [Bacteroidales bacterium]
MKRIGLYLLLLVAVAILSSCSKTEKNYYPDGNLQSTIHYRMGKESGKSVYYYDNPNTVEIEVEMKHGKRNGEFSRYFENGYLDTRCHYVNDSIEGVETMFTANGVKSQEFTYEHGKKNGPHKAYHLTGDLKIEGGFKNDHFDGPWKYYDERGVLVGEGEFKDGTGEVTFYDPRGMVLRTTQYRNDKKNGKEIYYSSTGNIYKEIVFKDDRIVSEKMDSTKMN